MGKTKTAVISEAPDKELSGKEKYLAKQKKRQELEAKDKAQVTKVGLKGGERIKVVGGDVAPVETDTEQDSSITTEKKRSAPKIRSKKYKLYTCRHQGKWNFELFDLENDPLEIENIFDLLHLSGAQLIVECSV